MDGAGVEHWRFNSDTTWHYFCSMQYEAVKAAEANNKIIYYHHMRSCVYFAVSCIESFLNKMMRSKLEADGLEEEEEILKFLRRGKMQEKLSDWPSLICSKRLAIPEQARAIFDTFRDVRNEITHPKRRDHSIYVELDHAQPAALIDAVARTIVTILSGQSRPFPYWVLGWNYVGMNGNPAHPFEGNNLNGFVHSLRSLGFRLNNLGSDLDWERRSMTTIEGYEELRIALAGLTIDIEPYWNRFPTKPRLTRRWWDHEFILDSIPKASSSNASG